VRQAIALAVAGVIIGLAAAALAARAVQGLLFVDARGFDPITFSASAVILMIAALLASYIPARRAARVSPVNALGR
jgi:ABC-type antimicrobial peptide transport system permease subunit